MTCPHCELLLLELKDAAWRQNNLKKINQYFSNALQESNNRKDQNWKLKFEQQAQRNVELIKRVIELQEKQSGTTKKRNDRFEGIIEKMSNHIRTAKKRKVSEMEERTVRKERKRSNRFLIEVKVKQ